MWEFPCWVWEYFAKLQRGWEHLEVHRRTGEGYQHVSEVCVWLPDRITGCWYSTAFSGTILSPSEALESTWRHQLQGCLCLPQASKHLPQTKKQLQAPVRSHQPPTTSLVATARSLGESWITVEQPRNKTSCFGRLLAGLDTILTTHHWTIFLTHLFCLYSHLCIHVSMYVYS